VAGYSEHGNQVFVFITGGVGGREGGRIIE
jgi:hypothetical protein